MPRSMSITHAWLTLVLALLLAAAPIDAQVLRQAPAPAPYVPEPDGAAPARTEKAKPVKSPKPARPPRELSLPAIPALAAAIVSGVLVGILACGATWLALQGCQAIRGTSSCGGPGFLLLLAILVGLVLVGSALLKVFRVPDSGSTSFLAVGLMAVIVLLFLVDVLFDWWMILVIPVVAAATFALSHWVTARFSEVGDVEG